jgi:hypothetical protein
VPAKPYLPHAAMARSGDELEAEILEEAKEEERFVHWMNVSQEVATEHKDATGWEEPAPGPIKRLSDRLHRHRPGDGAQAPESGGDTLAVIAELPPRGLPARLERLEEDASRQEARVARRR